MSLGRICIIGCGNMGGACLSGWLASDKGPARKLASDNFVVVVPSESSRARIESEFGVDCVSSVNDISNEPPIDLILLAIKPQVLPQVVEELANSSIFQDSRSGHDGTFCNKYPLVLSIAAGVSTDSIEDILPEGASVVRAMPNMPLQVGRGATAVCGGRFASEEQIDLCNQLFDALGVSSVTDESLIDAVCAISGGGPAYVAYMIEALRDAGTSLGLDALLAQNLALETVGGTYELMKERKLSPEQMRQSVCSPGGTTLAALAELDKEGFVPMFDSAMRAAVNRAAELREGA